MKIAMWSPTVFAGRKSTNLLVMALQAITEGEGEQLIIHADPSGSGPEHFMLSGSHRRRMMSEKEFGVEFLANSMRCERFSKEQVINAAYSFLDGNLHILPAGGKGFYARDDRCVTDTISRMAVYADEVFRNVWIELPAGESRLAERILPEADCVIVNLAQSPFEVEKVKEVQQSGNAFFLLGAYEQRNIFSVHNLELLYPQLRGRCGIIPYCSGLLGAGCRGETEAFWMRGVSQKDELTFFSSVERTYTGWKGRCVTDR